MHGLFLSSVQHFVTDLYGVSTWSRVVETAGLEFAEFESMLTYSDEIGQVVMAALPVVLERPLTEILEDIGIYLVSQPRLESLRRLLRFGGTTFVDFLHTLDDLPERARLAAPDLNLPRLHLREHSPSYFSLTCQHTVYGFGHVFSGILRAMADDYGALALVEHDGGGKGTEVITITLLEATHSTGRDFTLGGVP